MIEIKHKGYKITLSQKGETVTAKIASVIVSAEGSLEAAITKAKHFIDAHCEIKDEQPKVTKVPVAGEVR
jgi:hypothetical protein